MGKLNYAARRTQGVKAGQSVSKDLKKRIPPGTGSKAAARDPYLEIDLSGKELTDDGFAEFSDDLIACLDFRGDDHPDGAVKLTELSLKGNKLTVVSLEKLGLVIARSNGDLRDLDISENQITIDTPEHAAIWEGFLKSFQGCYVLKRIDFSGNELGAKGFELLCRTYMQSDLDFVEPMEDDNGVEKNDEGESALHETMSSLSLRSGKENVKPSSESIKGSKSKATKTANASCSTLSAAMSPAEIKLFASTRGLRSVPYLIFADVGLTNECAFHLSIILLSHRLPEALLAFLPPGKSVAPVQDGDENPCKGIVYLPNEKFERLGRRLIELAEINRQEVIETESGESDLDDSSSQAGELGTSTPGHYSPYVNWGRERGTKRREMRKHHQTHLERSKKLILLDILKAEGPHRCEIWSVAFKMMVVARAILLEDKFRPVKDSGEPPEEDKAQNENVPGIPKEPALLHEPLPQRFNPSSAPQLFAPGMDDFDINFPTIQGSTAATSTQVKPTVDPCTPERTINHGRKKSHNHNHGHGRSALGVTGNATAPEVGRFGLPMEVWCEIIADAVGARGILNKAQQMGIIKYATDWNALDQEIAVQGAAVNQQVWRILENVHCLAYTSMP
ncbi:hypothetical protein FQN54_004619 [Arachnomyces sp. PD_36]|nr:hypothetical protein FQN54_004619 [Arachnomyces sp. PD_36]